MKSFKILRYTLVCVCVTAVCLCFTGGGLMMRYVSSGVNPLREIRMATLGEAIVVQDSFDGGEKNSRQLTIDGINHGSQYLADKKAPRIPFDRIPTTYYHSDGPIGMAFSKFNWFPNPTDPSWHANDVRIPCSLVADGLAASTGGPWPILVGAWSEPPVAVIMMNNGTLAAYARPLQTFDFYERNPKIKELSFDPNPRFTYVKDAKKRGAHLRVWDGNERARFDSDAPQHFYHLIVLDTSRGHPGIPAKELITSEALQKYTASLVDDGVICVHTSSRSFRLIEIIAATAQAQKLAHLRLHDPVGEHKTGHFSSEWLMLARDAKHLEYLRTAAARLEMLQRGKRPEEKLVVEPVNPVPAHPAWTDAGANSLADFRR